MLLFLLCQRFGSSYFHTDKIRPFTVYSPATTASADFLLFVVCSLPSRSCRLYIHRFRLVIGFRIVQHANPLCTASIGSCSSGRDFASCFLQRMCHHTTPCSLLTVPTSGSVRDFNPRDSTHAGRTEASHRLTTGILLDQKTAF